MQIIALIIIVITAFLIVRRYQTHATLFISGFALLTAAHVSRTWSGGAGIEESITGLFAFDLFAMVSEAFSSRVARIGSVEVRDQMTVERYSHVMYIVSNVSGRLRDGLSAMDLLRAALPAGTLSGAPKIRAMEIINEFEPVKRGIYSGAVGYLSWNGNMDTAIAIRTAVIKDKHLSIQAGAGIVYDSVPENEWAETMNKARAIFRAVSLAEAGLDSSQ